MNTSTDAMTPDGDRPRAMRAAPHATHKFKLLLKREFWEHKGGFFWAPVWAGAISLVLTLMALVVGEVAARRAVGDGINIKGDIHINGLDLSALTSRMDADDLQKLAGGIDLSTLLASAWPMIVLAFVVFFYCLGSLYDERKDRSVLFWKSLPVSDRDTVLSKVVSALLVAPAIATAVGIVCMIAFLLLLSLFVVIHHGNPFVLLWSPGNLLANAGVNFMGDAAVIDGIATCFKMAETLVDLKTISGMAPSRRGYFHGRPDPARVDQVLGFYGLQDLGSRIKED